MTFIGITAGGNDRARLRLRSSLLSPRPLQVGAARARVALVATSALLLGGDNVSIGIDVGLGCRLEVVDIAGTVAYDARDAVSTWTVNITVADGGRLFWKAEPFVIAGGSNVCRRTTLDLAAGAQACLRETLVLGRTGEQGGAVRARTRVSLDGQPLLAEDLDLADPAARNRPGILGGYRVIDTASVFGRRAATPVNARCFQLAGEGTVARYLGGDLHRSAIPEAYGSWRNELSSEWAAD